MSSSRKRAAIAKANREVDYLKQKLMLTEHHLSVMSTMAKLTAIKHDEKQIQIYELKLKYCPDEITEQEHEFFKKSKQTVEEVKQIGLRS